MQAFTTGLIAPPPSSPSSICRISSRPLSFRHHRAGKLTVSAGAGDGSILTPSFWSTNSAEALGLPASAASIEEIVKQSLSSPLQQNGKIGEFILFSAGLCLMFWLGNYVVPDLLVKRIQSADEDVGKDDAELKDKRQDPKKDRILDALVGSSDSKPSISMGSSEETPKEDCLLLDNDTSKGLKRSPRRFKKQKQKS